MIFVCVQKFFVLLYTQEFYSPKVLPHFLLQNVQEFQSAHVHNDLGNFQKADEVAVIMGQLSQLPNCHS